MQKDECLAVEPWLAGAAETQKSQGLRLQALA